MNELQRIIVPGRSEVIVKKSRFLGYAGGISSEEDAERIISETRKKHYDARHVCFAWTLGDVNPTLRFSDDGEPQGTAGKPILDVISGSGVSDFIITVTRYFGGTLLGTGGLVRAYSDAARQALGAAGIGTLMKCLKCSISIEYSDFEKVRYMLEQSGIQDFDAEYSDKVMLLINLPVETAEKILGTISDITRGGASVERLGEDYIMH